MTMWTDIRRRVLTGQTSKRAICREYDIHWKTLEKILKHEEPPGYRAKQPRHKPVMEAVLPIIKEILKQDRAAHPKQRHTAKRIHDRLRQEHQFTGSYSSVKEAVRELKRKQREIFVPLEHAPGSAQVDFGEVQIKLDSELIKAAFFELTLPFSGAIFCQVFPRENTETFQEGHRRAFEFFGGVPSRISYDNSRIAVATFFNQRGDEPTREFLRLQSHYLFEHHFCRVRRGNEKGHVENHIGFARRKLPGSDSRSGKPGSPQSCAAGELSPGTNSANSVAKRERKPNSCNRTWLHFYRCPGSRSRPAASKRRK